MTWSKKKKKKIDGFFSSLSLSTSTQMLPWLQSKRVILPWGRMRITITNGNRVIEGVISIERTLPTCNRCPDAIHYTANPYRTMGSAIKRRIQSTLSYINPFTHIKRVGGNKFNALSVCDARIAIKNWHIPDMVLNKLLLLLLYNRLFFPMRTMSCSNWLIFFFSAVIFFRSLPNQKRRKKNQVWHIPYTYMTKKISRGSWETEQKKKEQSGRKEKKIVTVNKI